MKFQIMLVVCIYYSSALYTVAGVIPGFEPVWEVEKPKVITRSSSKEVRKTSRKSETNSSSILPKGRAWTDPVIGMEFVFVKGGCFQMGSPSSEKDRDSDEGPLHGVCVDDFYMGKYEVTVGQWREFIRSLSYRTEAERDVKKDGCWSLKNGDWGYYDGIYWDNVGFSQKESQPVACVSYNDVEKFIHWLRKKSGRKYRLPTEAEWEYAARGGTTTARFWGDGERAACRYANVYDQTAKRKYDFSWKSFDCDDGYDATAPVGSFKPNNFGLYDMLGNVWEWTGDWYGGKYYANSPRNNSQGPASGSRRVNRGGGWDYGPAYVRSADRDRGIPWLRYSYLGFRLVLSPGTAE